MPPRFTGELDEIAAVLARHAPTPDFLLHDAKAPNKVNVQRVLAKRLMWRELKAMHQSLSWSPCQAETLMLGVAERCKSSWTRALTDDELDDFKKKMGQRFRAQATIIKQASIKHGGKTAWLKQLWHDAQEQAGDKAKTKEDPNKAETRSSGGSSLGDQGTVGSHPDARRDSHEVGEGGAAAAGGHAQQEAGGWSLEDDGLHYDYDHSTGRAWRATDPKSKKTYADEVFMPDDSSPGDPTLARFGSEVKQLKAFTCEMMLMRRSYQLLSRGAQWQGKLGDISVMVSRRKDRNPLWAISQKVSEKWQMICSVVISTFGEGDKSLCSAFDFMKSVAIAYCDKKVECKDLYKYRDKKLHELGLTVGVRKRPAASSTTMTTSPKMNDATHDAEVAAATADDDEEIAKPEEMKRPAAEIAKPEVMKRPAAKIAKIAKIDHEASPNDPEADQQPAAAAIVIVLEVELALELEPELELELELELDLDLDLEPEVEVELD